jgi:hypothetical protein
MYLFSTNRAFEMRVLTHHWKAIQKFEVAKWEWRRRKAQ